MTDTERTPEDMLQDVLKACKKAGASDADVRLSKSNSESVSVREGALELVERDEDAGLALRCFFGRQQASV